MFKPAVMVAPRHVSREGPQSSRDQRWWTVCGRKRNRKRPPVHVIGIDEVSRRKGQVYLTVVYDLERRVLLWVGEDRTEEAVKKFFTEEMGRRRCSTLQVVCMDMWAAYVNLVFVNK